MLEAAVTLTIGRGLLACVPFARLARAAGAGGDAATEPRAHELTVVSRALSAAARRLPWKSTCLVQAVAGHLMLRWRGVPSTIVLGAKRRDDALDAHAWLLAGNTCVCGGDVDGYARLEGFVIRPGLDTPGARRIRSTRLGQ